MSKNPKIPHTKDIKKRKGSLLSRFLRRNESVGREGRPEQLYALMTDLHIASLDIMGSSQTNNKLAIMRYADQVDPESKNKWLYTSNSTSYEHFISMIEKAILSEEKVKKKSRKEEIIVNIIGHGGKDGIQYSGNRTAEKKVVSLPQLVQDITSKEIRNSADQRLGFYFAACEIGVGIGSTSTDPEKIARKERQEREMQEKLPDNTICLVGAGNKKILSEQDEEMVKEIAYEKYSILEKALISVSLLPKTIKLVYKDKKGRLFTHKSNFTIPRDGQSIDAKYVKQQIEQRMSDIILFAQNSRFEKSEIAALTEFRDQLQKKLTDEYAHDYLGKLIFEKLLVDNKRIGFIWSKLDDKAKEYIYNTPKFLNIVIELFEKEHYKTLVTILNQYNNIDRKISYNDQSGKLIFTTLRELKDAAEKQIGIQTNSIKQFIDCKKQQGVKKIILDEKILLLADTENKRDLLQLFLAESRKAGLPIEVYVSKETFKNNEKNLTEIISDKNEFKICESEEAKANQIKALSQDKTVLNCANATRALTLNDVKTGTVEELFTKILRRGTQGIIIDADTIKDESLLIEFLSFATKKNPEMAKNIVIFFANNDKYNSFISHLPEDIIKAERSTRPKFFTIKNSFGKAVSEFLQNAPQDNIDIFCSPPTFKSINIPSNKSLIPVAKEFNYSTLFFEAHLLQHEVRISPAPSTRPSSIPEPRKTSAWNLTTGKEASFAQKTTGNSEGNSVC